MYLRNLELKHIIDKRKTKRNLMFMKRLLSAIQPSGELTLGNYLGSIRQFVSMQGDYESFLAVADMHSITVPQDPKALQDRNRIIAAYYLASGLNEKNCTFFIQSEVRLHAELSWVFECIVNMGELSRMTQFKAKTEGKKDLSIPCGLFTYPVLMAADILLYDADVVPVGKDQKQHVELARNIAQLFNSRYSPTFKVPEPIIPSIGAKIMDLQNPQKKMSKSAQNTKGVIFLTDDEKQIRKKISSSLTDLDNYVDYDEEKKPGISNLLSIYSSINNISINDALSQMKGMSSYGEFKKLVADSVVELVVPLHEKMQNILDSGKVDEILDRGVKRARIVAEKKFNEVASLVGFGRR